MSRKGGVLGLLWEALTHPSPLPGRHPAAITYLDSHGHVSADSARDDCESSGRLTGGSISDATNPIG